MLIQIENDGAPLLLDCVRQAEAHAFRVDGDGLKYNLLARLRLRLERETEKTHKVVREITYEGSIGALREQLGRSMAEGTRRPNAEITLSVRGVSDSRPENER